MNNLMCSVHLMATDSQFQAAFESDSELALARRGLALSKLELKALSRVWSLVKDQVVLAEIPNARSWRFRPHPPLNDVC
jgi:uncharacterized protein (DUF2384 family)